MRVLIAVGCALALTATSAPAKDPKEDKLICKRRSEPEVGTHLRSRTKTCMRASDWKELESLNENAKRRIQDRAPVAIDPSRQSEGAGGFN